MSVINISTTDELTMGKQLTFKAPCNCEGVTGLSIKGTTFALKDALGNAISGEGSKFIEGSLVSVLLDTTSGSEKAYLLNGASESPNIFTIPLHITMSKGETKTFSTGLSDITPDKYIVFYFSDSSTKLVEGGISIKKFQELNNKFIYSYTGTDGGSTVTINNDGTIVVNYSSSGISKYDIEITIYIVPRNKNITLTEI